MNGLCGGLALVSAVGVVVREVFVGQGAGLGPVGISSLALAAALVPFLLANWPRGRVFLGDSGSLLLGGWFAGLFLVKRDPAILLLCAVPLADLASVSVLPLRRDKSAARPIWRFELPLPRAAVVRTRLEAPSGSWTLSAEGPARLRPSGSTGSWDLLAAPGSIASLILGKGAEPEDRSSLPLRYEVTAATAVSLARTQRRVRAWLNLRVLQGRIDELEIPFPADLEPVEVSGDTVLSWDVVGENLRLSLGGGDAREQVVAMHLTGPPVNSLTVPLLAPEGAERAHHFSKVAVSGDGLLSLLDAGSGRAVDGFERALPAGAFDGEPGRSFSVGDPGRPPRWQVEWADQTQVLAAQVDEIFVDIAFGGEGRAYYRLWAEVRSSGASLLNLTPPPAWTLTGSLLNGSPLTPAQAGDSLVLPLRQGEEPQVFFLEGFLPLPLPEQAGDLRVPIPAFSAPVARVAVRAVLPEERRATLIESGRRGSAGQPPQGLASTARSPLAKRLLGDRRRGPLETPVPFDPPPGSGILEAAWSALSPRPAPLVVRISAGSTEREWF